MFLPMRCVGFIVCLVVLLPWLALGHARLETVLSCGYRLWAEASAPGYAKIKDRPLYEKYSFHKVWSKRAV